MNNNLKPTLWMIFFTLCILLWFRWEAANAPPPPPVTATQAASQSTDGASIPAVGMNNNGQVIPGSAPQAVHSGELITVTTDVLKLHIDTVGGTIVESDLLQYPVSVEDNTPIKLFDSAPGQLFHLQSGLKSNQANSATHQANFTAPQKSYVMTSDSLSVPLTWQQDGVTVTKTFVFQKGRYEFAINQRVENQSGQQWSGYQYRQLKRTRVEIPTGLTTFNTFAGAAYSTPEKQYDRLNFDDLGDKALDIKGVVGGWEAMIQHYFMGALIPVQTEKNTFYSNKTTDGYYNVGMYGETVAVPTGSSAEFTTTGFVGPKVKNDLARIAPNLDKATDYGFLFFISDFLFNVLDWVHSIVKNWGWAIVIVTLAIKIVLFPLAAKSFKSMAKMRKFQPEMERIRENYKEDRQLLGKKMMELYKKEGINPASGCLPILVQLPIFLAFYYMLMESVELRQAPWIFWIKDLSLKDPLYILPVINMGLMFLQQRLNPPPSDPMQRRMMTLLPLIFGVFFLFFPAGLVLYWAVSNLFSIIQQYVITKRYGGLAHPLSHAEDKHYTPPSKK